MNLVHKNPFNAPHIHPTARHAINDNVKATEPDIPPRTARLLYVTPNVTTLRVPIAPTEISISPIASINIIPRVIKL